jgi:hypothetical protein
VKDKHPDGEILLVERGVFDIDHYGWLNEDDVDPEFVGYAMWVLNAPYDHDFTAWQDGKPRLKAATRQEQTLMEWGHDFFGLMKTARYFIGQGLMEQTQVTPLEIEATRFDFAEFAALAALGAAADRLRDFLVVAVLQAKTKSPTQLDEAYERLRQEGLGEQ